MPRSTKPKGLLSPAGNITSQTKEALRADLLALVGKGETHITLDFSKVDVIDSTGIGLLVATCNSLKEKGGDLIVQHASNDIQKMFRIMRLDRHIQLI